MLVSELRNVSLNGFKQMNFSEYQSEAFKKYEAEVNEIINERKK